MADQTITIPRDVRDDVRMGWINYDDIDTHLTAGNDVIFKDEDGNERNVNYFGFLKDSTTERSIRFRGVGMTDAQAVTGSFSSGLFHPCPLSKIFADGTTTNGNLRVRMA